MKSFVLLALLVISFQSSGARDFYVSPWGKDSNPGTKELPFLTLAHARGEVRNWNRENTAENVTVWLAGGEYRLTETLVFGPEDSAKPGQTITFAALPGEKPVINSDVRISDWEKLKKTPSGLPGLTKGKIWVAQVPETMAEFKVMYNANGMLPRARTHAISHLRTSGQWVGSDDMQTTIPFKAGTTASLFHPANTEILVIPAAPWTMNILPVSAVDHNTGLVTLGAKATYALAAPRFYMGPDAIWVENTFAGLDEPGEWVYDAKESLIYYWPVNNEKPDNDIVVPGLIEMIRVEGRINYDGPEDIPVKGLIFSGLTFTHGNRFNSSGQTGSGLQHDWERFDESTALMRFRGAENCSVENCTFVNSGGAGIRLDLYAQNIHVYNNEFSELGGTAVLLAGYGPGIKDVNKNNTVQNNLIHHIGRIWWHAPAIWAWQSGYNLISDNTIHHVPYTAIMVTGRINWDKTGKSECSKTVRWSETGLFTGKECWEERERFLHGRHNRIINNDIHHVMEVMQDGNGVYISGAGHGNEVCGNYVHDTESMAAGEAIRCDDDQHETLIENNIVFRFGTHGIGICSKGRNHIVNNIVACPPERVIRGMLSLEPTDDMINAGSRIFHNIFYATRTNQPFVFSTGMERVIGTIQIDRNIYFNASVPEAAGEYFNWARKKGREEKSISADPLFIDAENGNFELRPNSPALDLGFRPFVITAGRKKIN